nr:putative ribonuclease H-like domain-containing protein [Tanacetum cinerariifolium]
MNKLVKGNLVRGLPCKLFENVETGVACQKGKQHKASCKTKTENSISLPLHLLHMDLFGLTFIKSLMKKMYYLVVIDDYSRFTWVLFLATKDETTGILKSFITRIENLVDHKVKVIRYDNGTEFKNREMNQFCEMKGRLRQFSVARIPQQNRFAKNRNRTPIEAFRTMLVDSKLPTNFWLELVNTTCYVQNKLLVVKPHNKTSYKLFHGRTLALRFTKPFRCHVTILSTLDRLGKFDGKFDEGFFVGYSMNSKAFRVFNSRKKIVEENLHIRFCKNTLNVIGSVPDWLFDIDALTRTMNYEPIVAGTQSNGLLIHHFPEIQRVLKMIDSNLQVIVERSTNRVNVVSENISNELPFDHNMPYFEDINTFNFSSDHKDDVEEADMNNMDTIIQVSPVPTTRIHKDHLLDQVIGDLHSTTQTRNMSKNLEEHEFVTTIHQRTNHKDLQNCLFTYFLSQEEPKKQDGIFISQDKYVAEILKKYGFSKVKNARTPMETQKPLLKDEDSKEVDVHMYRSMISSLMYLTSLRPDIMFVVCACARYQVNPKVSHLHAVKSIFSFFFFSSIAVQTSGSGISSLLVMVTTFTGSGNLYCQWEHLTWQWECLVHFIPNNPPLNLMLLLHSSFPE